MTGRSLEAGPSAAREVRIQPNNNATFLEGGKACGQRRGEFDAKQQMFPAVEGRLRVSRKALRVITAQDAELDSVKLLSAAQAGVVADTVRVRPRDPVGARQPHRRPRTGRRGADP